MLGKRVLTHVLPILARELSPRANAQARVKTSRSRVSFRVLLANDFSPYPSNRELACRLILASRKTLKKKFRNI